MGELIFLVWSDLVGISRTRGVPVGEYDRRRAHGLGWALAGQALTPFEDIAPNPWGPMDEVRQTPDDATRCRIVLKPDWPALHMVLCDSLDAAGRPWSCCTRSFLAQTLADLEDSAGLRVHIACENEFSLSGEDGEDLAWAAPFSLDAVRRIAPFADLCTTALLDADLGLETFEPEYGVGQFEISCAPATGLAGADRVVLTREVVREAARQCALHASFTPKPAPEAVGNGCHLHISLWDRQGRPASFDPEGPGQMSQAAASFVAGIRRHLPALVALTAPSPVSYLRLGPHHWSCGFDAVGVNNREAAIRICPSPERDAARRGHAFNLEYRAIDATANPYLAIGAIVKAGMEGIAAGLPAPPLIARDPAEMSAQEREASAIHPLPASLEAALDAFAADATAQGWFAPIMVEAYGEVKRMEARMWAAQTPERMCERYARAY